MAGGGSFVGSSGLNVPTGANAATGNNDKDDNKNNEIGLKFDMNQLETVWDNDTDEEQIRDCRDLLAKELFDVINYFVKNDPLEICQNLDK